MRRVLRTSTAHGSSLGDLARLPLLSDAERGKAASEARRRAFRPTGRCHDSSAFHPPPRPPGLIPLSPRCRRRQGRYRTRHPRANMGAALCGETCANLEPRVEHEPAVGECQRPEVERRHVRPAKRAARVRVCACVCVCLCLCMRACVFASIALSQPTSPLARTFPCFLAPTSILPPPRLPPLPPPPPPSCSASSTPRPSMRPLHGPHHPLLRRGNEAQGMERPVHQHARTHARTCGGARTCPRGRVGPPWRRCRCPRSTPAPNTPLPPPKEKNELPSTGMIGNSKSACPRVARSGLAWSDEGGRAWAGGRVREGVGGGCWLAFFFQTPGKSSVFLSPVEKGLTGQKWFVTPRDGPPVTPMRR